MNTEVGLDSIFGALGNSKRRDMVHLLSLRPATVKQLAEENDLSFPAVHKHIRALENADLIIRRKVGRTNFVVLNRYSLKKLQYWVDQYHTYWGSDQESLENYIASMKE